MGADSEGVGFAIRLSISIAVALSVGLFMLLWDGLFIPHSPQYALFGPFLITPIIATVLGFVASSGVQQLSCGQVDWLNNFIRSLFVPALFIIWWLVLYFVPSLRWPIEGLFQAHTPNIQKGVSSGFYTFWLGLYSQSILNGFAQMC
jgi:hypothetical protein